MKSLNNELKKLSEPTLKEKINIFIKRYKNIKTKDSFKPILNKIFKDAEEINIEAINELLESYTIKGSSKNIYRNYARIFITWHNREYDTRYKVHNLESFVDDREQKTPYTLEEEDILKEMLTAYNKPVFTFLFYLQWENACRVDELGKIDWKNFKENGKDMVFVSKTRERNKKRTMMCIPGGKAEEAYKLVADKLIQKGFKIQSHKNDFTTFKKFVLKHYPNFKNRISSHQLRQDRITKMSANGLLLADIMSVTQHESGETLLKFYINSSPLTMEQNLILGNMDFIQSNDIKALKQERVRYVKQASYLKDINKHITQKLAKQEDIIKQLQEKLNYYENANK